MNDIRWKQDSLSGVMERAYILPYLCVMQYFYIARWFK